jgi:hypothetical protein
MERVFCPIICSAFINSIYDPVRHTQGGARAISVIILVGYLLSPGARKLVIALESSRYRGIPRRAINRFRAPPPGVYSAAIFYSVATSEWCFR